MKTDPKSIFDEYKKAENFKQSLGSKGIAEQSKINERFYRGDQWHGAVSGGERPLVRHNVIKRIGDFKMSQILSGKKEIKYTVEGLPWLEEDRRCVAALKSEISAAKAKPFSGVPGRAELSLIAQAIGENRRLCAERLQFGSICAEALKEAYVTGTGIVYTFWDSAARGGRGDIGCEVLSVNDVFFADPYEKQVQNQPYIIICGWYGTERILRESGITPESTQGKAIAANAVAGKVQVFTKLYKQFGKDGSFEVMCVKTTENAVIKKPFKTGLYSYPVSVFCFEERENVIYGDSEVTYLIPNQIAINRMITANVWSSMSTGMPIMVVNGDCVSADITNDPGQIIKVYGSSEEVRSAVNFISPPDFSKDFSDNVNNLIHNTLTQSGATAAVLGDEIMNNATALSYLRGSAVLSLEIQKERYRAFIKEIALIWADFYFTCYGERQLKMTEGENVYYIPFSAARYKGLTLVAEDYDVADEAPVSAAEKIQLALTLFEKEVIDKARLVSVLSDAGVLEEGRAGEVTL